MKKFVVGIALGASLISTAAMAGEQRPTYMAFSAPTVAQDVSVPAPAAPRVAKRAKATGSVPLYIPLIGAVAVVGIIAAVSGGDNGSPG